VSPRGARRMDAGPFAAACRLREGFETRWTARALRLDPPRAENPRRLVAQAIWKGHITFGLVEIPVNLVSAEDPERVRFSLVDRRDASPVGYVRINKNTGDEVPWVEIVKGYEVDDGQYVLFSQQELERVSPERTKSIPILGFVDGNAIDHLFWDTPYYLVPARKGANRAYVLLREALEASGKVGIAQVVLRTRQHLAALDVRGELLTLNLLRYAGELRDPEEIGTSADVGKEKVTEREMKMALELIESMSEEWNPDAYADDYAKDLLTMVEKKVKSGKLQAIEGKDKGEREEDGDGKVLDLMPLLEKSVKRGKSSARATGARSPRGKSVARSKKPAKRSKTTRTGKATPASGKKRRMAK
jgi:DNA end-binding protein Ku